MTITSPLELSVFQYQGAFKVLCVSGQSALILLIIEGHVDYGFAEFNDGST